MSRDFVSENNVKLFSRLLSDCLDVSDEQVLLVGDRGVDNKFVASPFITNMFARACSNVGVNHEVHYQNTKTRGESADPVLINKLLRLPKKSVVILNVSNRIGRMNSLQHSFRSFMKEQKHKFISASSLGTISKKNLSVFIDSLDVNYSKLDRLGQKIKKKLDVASEVQVFTKAGTDLTIGINNMSARVSSGLYAEPGQGGNLPGAETYIAPDHKNVNGKIVIDGSSRVKDSTVLIRSKAGIRLDVENGEIVKLNNSLEAKKLNDTLLWAHKKSKFPWGVRRIGELGIGLNSKAKIIGSMILDEKVLGTAHIAIGSNKWFGGSIASIIHLDQVMRDATIKVDSRLLKF